jgi:hypothetical protein
MREVAPQQAAIARERGDAPAGILRALVPGAKPQEILVVGEGFEEASLRGRHSTPLMGERCTACVRKAVKVSGISRHEVALRGNVAADELRDTKRKPEPDQIVGPAFLVPHDADATHARRVRTRTEMAHVMEEGGQDGRAIRAGLPGKLRRLECVGELGYTFAEVVGFARAFEEREDLVCAELYPGVVGLVGRCGHGPGRGYNTHEVLP